jgi:hypothetical protein
MMIQATPAETANAPTMAANNRGHGRIWTGDGMNRDVHLKH